MTTLNTLDGYRPAPKPHYSIPSLLAVACAIGSFFVATGTMTLLLAIGAAVFGAIGVLVALLPGVRGGFISTLSILLGLVGLIVAIVRFVSTTPTSTY